MGLKPPVESSICFSIVYAQKLLSKLCFCIYEIQKFCAGKRKNLYWIQLEDFCPPDALAPPILYNS